MSLATAINVDVCGRVKHVCTQPAPILGQWCDKMIFILVNYTKLQRS